MRLSVVVPVHNEAEHLAGAVDEFLVALPPAVATSMTELLLVENGSRDGTLEVCRALAERHGTVRVLVAPRGSYGEAVRMGLLAAEGDVLAVLECDLLDVGFLERTLAHHARDGAVFIVASKRHPASRDRRPFRRRALTWGFNQVLRVTTGYPGTDTHGLKSMDGALARALCAQAQTTDEAFQTELVLLAWRQGHPILELSVALREVRPTPVAVGRRVPSVFRMLGALRASLARFPASPVGTVTRA